MKNNRQPEIRFPGYTDAWEQRKLGDVAKFNPKSKLPDRFEYVDLESVVGTSLISHRTEVIENAPSRAQRLAKVGDVFYQTVRPYQRNNYLFDLPCDNYVFSTGYAQLRPYGDSYFLLSRVQEDRFVNNVLDRSTGTSYPAINSKDLAQIEIKTPKNTGEQKLIGSFFKQLDDTIALHQRELASLKQTKQGFLQKMFPKKGESIPEIRFPGFTDAWEQRKLKEISSETYGGGTPKTSIAEYWNGNFPWIQSSDLELDLLNDIKPSKFITESAIRNSAAKVVPANSIAIVTRVGVGKLAFMPFEYATSQDFLSLSNLRIDNQFGLYVLYKLLKKESNNTQGTSIKGITKDALLSKTIDVPKKLEEQQEIGSFFKQLDDTITLHQRELELLQETKKAFLQKMFV